METIDNIALILEKLDRIENKQINGILDDMRGMKSKETFGIATQKGYEEALDDMRNLLRRKLIY